MDLGCFVPASFKYIQDAQAYFISRYKSDTNLYNLKTGIKLDLLQILENKTSFSNDVLLGREAKLRVRIVCQKLTFEQSIARKNKALLLAKSRKYESSHRNQSLLNWSIFITNIPDEKF